MSLNIYNFKTSYAAECEKGMRNHLGGVYQIALILTPAYLKAASPTNPQMLYRVSRYQEYNH